jgi:hypothetical protein
MAAREDITAALVRQLLDYNPQTGELIWKIRTPDMFFSSGNWSAELKCKRFNETTAGQRAGCFSKEGYLQVKFGGRQYRAHRLIWLIVFGEFPAEEIDHLNGKRDDNSLANLRLANRSGNMQNKGKGANNTSGVIGVYWHKPRNKWRAIIRYNGRRIDLGRFDRIEDAANAYLEAKKKYHSFQPVPRELL